MGCDRQTLAEKEFKKVDIFGVEYHGARSQIDICYIVNDSACILGIVFQFDHSYPLFWVIFYNKPLYMYISVAGLWIL